LGRRRAREAALRVLYEVEVGRSQAARALNRTGRELHLDDEGLTFARTLTVGVLEHLRAIDERIAELSHGWELDRLPCIDRAILRLAVYELVHGRHAPPAAVISEAVELAKRYGTADSGRFVNGVLGSVARALGPEETNFPPA